jgi:hypothetical protein
MAENKKTLTVQLQVKELMYDITNKAFLTGRSREDDATKSYASASNMQASEDQEDSYQLRRSLTNAYASIKSLLGEYLDEEKSTSTNLIYDEIDQDTVLELAFRLPSNYNSASADSLGNGIHSYLVSQALSEWFTITNKEDAADYAAQAQASLEIAKRALYKRSRPSRPTYPDASVGVNIGVTTKPDSDALLQG